MCPGRNFFFIGKYEKDFFFGKKLIVVFLYACSSLVGLGSTSQIFVLL